MRWIMDQDASKDDATFRVNSSLVQCGRAVYVLVHFYMTVHT
jgi:hypothetical protein